jgi:uncharacterized protein YacL (UPF0231 family)
MSHRFYRDENGELRAATGRERRLLGRFLEADIQGSGKLCNAVLAGLEEVAAGRRKRWQWTGNAHTLNVGKRRARIQAEFGRSADLLLPTAELRLALLDWKALLGK